MTNHLGIPQKPTSSVDILGGDWGSHHWRLVSSLWIYPEIRDVSASRGDESAWIGEEKVETAEDLNDLEVIQDKIAALMERKAAG